MRSGLRDSAVAVRADDLDHHLGSAAANTDREPANMPTTEDRLAAFRLLTKMLGEPRSPQPMTPMVEQALALVRDNRSPREIAMALGITTSAVAGLLASIIG